MLAVRPKIVMPTAEHAHSSDAPETKRPSRTERLEQAAKTHRFPDLPASYATQHSDLLKDFDHFLLFTKNRGLAQARRETKRMLSGNFLSIAKEMKGRQWMQTGFKVKKTKAQTFFQRSEFKGGDDLRNYSTKVDDTVKNPEERSRFIKENLQMVDLFDTFAEYIAALEWSENPDEVTEQLQSLPDGYHFSPQTLPVTKELQILFPALKNKAGQQLNAWVSRPLVTVSPTSPVHLKRQTSLAWVNRLVYIPELHELVFLRDGVFSGYNDEEIAEFLTLDENWAEMSQGKNEDEEISASDYFQTEEELFAFIATLPDEYRQLHAHAILDEVIRRLGGFKPAPKINNVSEELTIDIDAMSEAILSIFEWELLTYGEDEIIAAQVGERLNYIKDIFLHHLATDTAINWQQSVRHYQTFFGQKQKAADPNQHVEEAQNLYAKFYPKLASLQIDLSVLDCGVGTIVGGFNNLNISSLQMKIGVEGLEMLRRFEDRPITTEAELKEFCAQFNKDYRRFIHNQGECVVCHHHTFLGECDICPVCEVKDDLGIKSLKLAELGDSNLYDQWLSPALIESLRSRNQSTTLGIVVASVATKNILSESQDPETSWLQAA